MNEAEETIFVGARQLSSPEERAAYLDQACGDDHALRRRVERMLDAEKRADQFLADDPLQIDEVAVPANAASEALGSMIGRYKVLQQIGEGGCGIVYMAEQEEPIRRRVALKVIKPGMDTKQVIARFEAERQALAMMDHPNIARVLDAGATDTGRPYFVMELVRGIRITEYCDQNNLSTRERLDLFTKVVQAVQHAHQKGIIHRDLKPSNVLITLHDGVPVPKVIDFGIAKALEQKLTDKTLFTQFEHFIGTPAYTSPEQAEMSGLDIDTRSDIYSLGVLLYELLVGKTPFETHDLLQSGLDEMRRIIREKEPACPSTRLSTMIHGEITTTAQRRRVSAPELIHLLKGDLDWIVMKCLEKDRTRRYETANGLAVDIQHYLSNEPVAARPPSNLYRFGKLVRRNKLAFAAGSSVLMALVIGIVVSTWQAARARRAEQKAQAEKESAEAVLQFFRDKVLAAGRPEGQKGGLGKDVTLRQAIDAAESKISEAFKDRPLVEAAIRKTLGESYTYLGEPALAVPQLERTLALRRRFLGFEHPSVSSAMGALGDAYSNARKHDQALPLLEETLKLRKARLGPEDPETLTSMNNLAIAYYGAGKLDQALPLLEATLKLERVKKGPEDFDTLATMNNLAMAYWDAGKLDQTLQLLEETLKLKRARWPEHPDTLTMMHNLADAYRSAGKLDRALPLQEETVKLQKAKLGLKHPRTLAGVNLLTAIYRDTGKQDRLLLFLEETVELFKAELGLERRETLVAMNNLAVEYESIGKHDRALALYEETMKLMKAKLGPDHWETLNTMNNLAGAYLDAGKLDPSEAVYREILREKNDHVAAMIGLAGAVFERIKCDTANPARAQEWAAESEQLMRDSLAKARSRYTNDPAKLEDTLSRGAELRYRQGKYAAAEPLFREIVQSRRARLSAEDNGVISATASLGRLLGDRAWAERTNIVTWAATSPFERAHEAERLLRECLSARLRDNNATHWRVDDYKSRLGGALVSVAVTDPELNAPGRDAKLAEAETLLLQGNQRLQESKSANKKYKRDALERLVRLYQAWGKSDQRVEWQQKLEMFDKAKTESSPASEQESQ